MNEPQVTLGPLKYHTVAGLIGLIKTGDGASLQTLRERLELPLPAIAESLGISENQLSLWESGAGTPSSAQLAKWRLRFGAEVDSLIMLLLGTDNPQVVHHFWELAWRLG
jgi:transcriptional regulator with XRE-family HTH domain